MSASLTRACPAKGGRHRDCPALTTIQVRGPDWQVGPCRLTPTGLIVQGAPPFDEWAQCGTLLRRMKGAVQFWIGDWLNFGEHAYGEKYSQALETGAIGLEIGLAVDGAPSDPAKGAAVLPQHHVQRDA